MSSPKRGSEGSDAGWLQVKRDGEGTMGFTQRGGPADDNAAENMETGGEIPSLTAETPGNKQGKEGSIRNLFVPPRRRSGGGSPDAADMSSSGVQPQQSQDLHAMTLKAQGIHDFRERHARAVKEKDSDAEVRARLDPTTYKDLNELISVLSHCKTVLGIDISPNSLHAMALALFLKNRLTSQSTRFGLTASSHAPVPAAPPPADVSRTLPPQPIAPPSDANHAEVRAKTEPTPPTGTANEGLKESPVPQPSLESEAPPPSVQPTGEGTENGAVPGAGTGLSLAFPPRAGLAPRASSEHNRPYLSAPGCGTPRGEQALMERLQTAVQCLMVEEEREMEEHLAFEVAHRGSLMLQRRSSKIRGSLASPVILRKISQPMAATENPVAPITEGGARSESHRSKAASHSPRSMHNNHLLISHSHPNHSQLHAHGKRPSESKHHRDKQAVQQPVQAHSRLRSWGFERVETLKDFFQSAAQVFVTIAVFVLFGLGFALYSNTREFPFRIGWGLVCARSFALTAHGLVGLCFLLMSRGLITAVRNSCLANWQALRTVLDEHRIAHMGAASWLMVASLGHVCSHLSGTYRGLTEASVDDLNFVIEGGGDGDSSALLLGSADLSNQHLRVCAGRGVSRDRHHVASCCSHLQF
uniref:Uncharacterized protein n=1 Tax=Chromera velia CCMP2878 TaxID=1169474 RepID=A0A0G4H990_9ALVE|eukprot:Cvel_25365.t1-p1 / transcript=Cvel_25365.t1 / gene=Cvel_25365 / organism=Chromera_velia_CCMP2878 / gene_product=hypothetical protein / transcript_product=hypothetical protein / location=Cvel_scaffold2863:14041-17098(-) / protein_length=642 / sequence_SO=supercontig / SO=protein_coding / is_pseudo=false